MAKGLAQGSPSPSPSSPLGSAWCTGLPGLLGLLGLLVRSGVGFEVGVGDWLFWSQPGDFRPALWPTSWRKGLCCILARHHWGCPYFAGGKIDRTEEMGPLAPLPVPLQARWGAGLSEPPAWPGRPTPLCSPIRVASSRGRRGCMWTVGCGWLAVCP